MAETTGSAAESNNYVLCSTSNKTLSHDADSSGGVHGKIAFATFAWTSQICIIATDFAVIA
ncbi:MAG: hypothetical protein WBN83_07580 [Desulfoprunum sp.]|uniref:hypothetical protein n=1 Tax=Desulfoprunum sp. TaxID=2020866 RepID=UPI003C71FFD3